MDVICRNCGKLVSSEIEKCPHCRSLLKKGAKSIRIDKEEIDTGPSLMPVNDFEKMFVIGILAVIGVIVAISLLLSFGVNFDFNLRSNNSEEILKDDVSVDVLDDNALTNEDVMEIAHTDGLSEEIPIEKTPYEKLYDYLSENEIETFGEQTGRLKSVQLESSTAYVTYTTTEADYVSESTYLVGATLMAIEEADKADVKGYNKDGMFMNESHRFKSRSDYRFDLYPVWFPDYEREIECETDADCDDGDPCTLNKCHDGICSTVEIVGCV